MMLDSALAAGYVAFVVDCFSRAMVGWHAATIKDTMWVTTALKMVLWRRDHTDRRVADGLIRDCRITPVVAQSGPRPHRHLGQPNRLVQAMAPTPDHPAPAELP